MIVCKSLTLGYDGKTVLENLNYTFPETRAVALMGASGSGKTTLLRAVGGLLKPMQGNISGTENKKIAFLFQEDRLLPWCSALQNVTLSGCGRERAAEWLKRLSIEDIDKLPAALSGGMARRVAIARALGFGGDLLLMDEPFTGLDEDTKQAVIHVILQTAPNIIMTTHDVQEAEWMNAKIIRMEDLKNE